MTKRFDIAEFTGRTDKSWDMEAENLDAPLIPGEQIPVGYEQEWNPRIKAYLVVRKNYVERCLHRISSTVSYVHEKPLAQLN